MNKLTLNHQEYQSIISSICREITNSGWRPDYIVGINGGGLYPSLLISQYFNVPLQILNKDESNLWVAEDAFGYLPYEGDELPVPTNTVRTLPELNKNILVVDDINRTGETFNWLVEDWQGGCLPNHSRWADVWNKNVKFAVVVDNTASKCNVKMDFTGVEVNTVEDDLSVEFPYSNWWLK
jgi:hypoxanthine phosphoribosyltransferase